MDKPIPEDVMRAVREAVSDHYMENGFVRVAERAMTGDIESSHPTVVDVVSRAILAERARCAAVAHSRINMYGEANAERDGAALSIAHGIESGEVLK